MSRVLKTAFLTCVAFLANATDVGFTITTASAGGICGLGSGLAGLVLCMLAGFALSILRIRR
jgi:hypothetical protein